MRQERPQFLRVLGFAFASLYVVLVGILTLMKVTIPTLVPVSWPEVLYGPALSLISIYIVVAVGILIEHRVRIELAQRSEQRESKS